MCKYGRYRYIEDISYEFDIEGGQKFCVEVIDPVEEYLKILKTVFNFDLIRYLISAVTLILYIDALNGINKLKLK